MIGNDDWLVPASADERRYAVFDVGEGRKQDTKFFHQMRTLFETEGSDRVLLHYLKTFDLSSVDVAPVTDALHDQKLSSLDPLFQWWRDCLTQGYVGASEFGTREWQFDIPKEQFINQFKKYIRDRNIKGRIPADMAISRALKHCLPSLVHNQKMPTDSERKHWVNCYRLPSLEVARKEWERFIGHDELWE